MRTFGSPILALVQDPGGVPSVGTEPTGLLDLFAHPSPISSAVLVVLAFLSIGCWSIIFYKIWVFRRTEQQSRTFLDVFRRSSKFSEVQAVCRSLSESPLVGLFQAGYAEITAQLRQSAPADAVDGTGANPKAGAVRPVLKSLGAVDRSLMRASVVEVNKLEKHIGFLATTASIAPFVGLFGTVVGIMMAFQGIGQTGSTNLGVVAPGIADALVATAAGLVAAVPAVVAYNNLSNRVRLFASAMDDFAMEFLNIAERNFT
ncbi:MAG: MotA/TolQ/ExbB proton channel family protein [Vicinamibacterales bacterium]